MSSKSIDRLASIHATDGRPSAGPFFVTPEQRIALARERFFEEGIRPSGLVPELVVQSWTRCIGARRRPRESLVLEPVTKARIETALARNRVLLEAAREDVSQLDTALAGTNCKAMLLGHDGVIVHATPVEQRPGALLPHVARVGVDLGETSVGTGAPNVAAYTGRVSVVRGGEHFFDGMSTMYCAAAPIRDWRGKVVGVLDISSENEMFRFDAASMVKLYAATIESRLLMAQSRQQLLLRFQVNPTLLHTPFEGLACLSEEGRVLWLNQIGANLLGSERIPGGALDAELMFGLAIDDLRSLRDQDRALPRCLPNGLSVWIDIRREPAAPTLTRVSATPIPEPASSPDAGRIESPVQSTPDQKLQDVNRALIESTFIECKRNVAKTARKLGVSRGLMYRRLRDWGLDRR